MHHLYSWLFKCNLKQIFALASANSNSAATYYKYHTHTCAQNACVVVCIANEFEQLTPIINPDKPIDAFHLAAFRINLH